jgi:hypothetical protein
MWLLHMCDHMFMNAWVRRIVQFARPLHKNISVCIQSNRPEEVEKVLDAIAKNTDWDCKEVKVRNGIKFISYQNKNYEQEKPFLNPAWNALRSLDYQVIEYIFFIENSSINLIIESRNLAPENKLALLIFYIFGFPVSAGSIFDVAGCHSNNIEHILQGLQKHFKDRVTVVSKKKSEKLQEIKLGKIDNVSISMSLLLACLRIASYLVVIYILLFIFLPLILSIFRKVYILFI